MAKQSKLTIQTFLAASEMIAAHLKQSKKRITIQKNQIEKGMVVFFRYKKLDGSSGQYVMNVMHENYQGKVHGLALNEVNVMPFRRFAKKLGIMWVAPDVAGTEITKVDVGDPKTIYEGIIKPKLPKELNNSYRTMFTKSISGVQLLAYDFGPQLMNTLGPAPGVETQPDINTLDPGDYEISDDMET